MFYKSAITSVLTILLAGCASIGPKQVHLDRNAYDEVVRQTSFQEILTNIVRLSYLEPTSYMQVTGVTASYSLSNSMGISGEFPFWSKSVQTSPGSPAVSTIERQFGISPSTTFTDSPTISYVPINSAQFVSVMQTPINFSDLNLLYNGGIDDFELLSRLVFNSMGPLDNASSLTDPRVVNKIEYQQYDKLLDRLLSMIHDGSLTVEPANLANHSVLLLQFKPGTENSPTAIAIKQTLKVATDSHSIIFMKKNTATLIAGPSKTLFIDEGIPPGATNIVFIKMRSIYGILTFLSHTVQIPASDIKAGFTQHILDKNGNPINWTPIMKGLMTIYSSDQEPEDAFVKVQVHGHWFYIKNTDIDSKTTFSLIMRLISLSGGLEVSGGQQSGPTLSLPIN